MKNLSIFLMPKKTRDFSFIQQIWNTIYFVAFPSTTINSPKVNMKNLTFVNYSSTPIHLVKNLPISFWDKICRKKTRNFFTYLQNLKYHKLCHIYHYNSDEKFSTIFLISKKARDVFVYPPNLKYHKFFPVPPSHEKFANYFLISRKARNFFVYPSNLKYYIIINFVSSITIIHLMKNLTLSF